MIQIDRVLSVSSEDPVSKLTCYINKSLILWDFLLILTMTAFEYCLCTNHFGGRSIELFIVNFDKMFRASN